MSFPKRPLVGCTFSRPLLASGGELPVCFQIKSLPVPFHQLRKTPGFYVASPDIVDLPCYSSSSDHPSLRHQKEIQGREARVSLWSGSSSDCGPGVSAGWCTCREECGIFSHSGQPDEVIPSSIPYFKYLITSNFASLGKRLFLSDVVVHNLRQNLLFCW